MFPAGAAPCQGTLAILSPFEGAVRCPLSNTCSKGDREDPKVLWEEGDRVTEQCQLPRAPSWCGNDPWKEQGNGGGELNPEGNYRNCRRKLPGVAAMCGIRAWHGSCRVGMGAQDSPRTHRGTALRLGGHLGCQQGLGCWAPAWGQLPVTPLHSRAGRVLGSGIRGSEIGDQGISNQ